MSQDKVAKYIEILRVIIICNGKPLTGNQTEITQLLLVDESMREKLMYKLRTERGHIQVCYNHKSEEWISLGKTENNLDSDSSGFDYFIAFTYLLGDLCKNRNYKAIEIVKTLIPYNICYSLVTSEIYSTKLRQAFSYLITVLWVDVYPFETIPIPSSIKFWEKPNLDRRKASSVVEKKGEYEELKKRVIEYCHKFEEYQMYEEEEIKLLNYNLKLQKKMIEFGIASEADIKEIFNILKSLLNTIIRIFQQNSDQNISVLTPRSQQLLDRTGI